MARIKTPQPCVFCGTSFYRHTGNLDAMYCSVSCRTSATNLRSNPMKRPEVAAKVGDALRDRGDGKTYRKRDGRHEHRIVAEMKLGRPLRKGEVVHHEDEDKRNNHPDNLRVFASQADHARYHKEHNAPV